MTPVEMLDALEAALPDGCPCLRCEAFRNTIAVLRELLTGWFLEHLVAGGEQP